jgi:hypothetical protein
VAKGRVSPTAPGDQLAPRHAFALVISVLNEVRTVQDSPKKRSGLELLARVVAISAALGISPAGAQEASAVTGSSDQAQKSATPAKQAAAASKTGQKARGPYYVDFRARTAASYGHAFVWYGRVNQKAVEIAGLHPATDSVVPYIIGHVVPVPSETGASYGDLDEEYLTASYRVFLSEPEAKRVFAYIKHKQANSPLWNAATYNCVAFIRDIAQHMGLRTPSSHLLYPEDWVNQLRELNSGPQRAFATVPAPSASSTPSALSRHSVY